MAWWHRIRRIISGGGRESASFVAALLGVLVLAGAALGQGISRTSIGYPSVTDELEVLRPGSGAGRIADVRTVTSPREVSAFSGRLSLLHVADPILHYISALGTGTRADDRLRLGTSTRGLRTLVRCAQVYAASKGRHFVVPQDVQDIADSVLAHRMVLTRESLLAGVTTSEVLADVLAGVPVPKPAAQ